MQIVILGVAMFIYEKSRFRTAKQFLLLFVGIMVALMGCGPSVDDDNVLTTASNSDGQQGYPNRSYPGPVNIEAYPVPPSTDIILQEPPAELPTFPGKIAFHSEQFTGDLQVAIFDGATGEVTRLNQTFALSSEPAWSPDCTRLVFTVGQEGGADFNLYQQEIGSSDASIFIAHPEFYDWGADWSPVNDVIAYQTNEDARINVCFADTAGNELGCMERGGFSNIMPAWSPDGSQLVFGSDRAGNWELYITDYPAMSSLNQLTNNSATDYDPVFSPDGSTILYASEQDGDFNLYSIQVDGQNQQKLTSDGAEERFPTWVGDNLIAYSASFQDESELYLMNRDGSNPQRLTYATGLDAWPSWCAAP